MQACAGLQVLLIVGLAVETIESSRAIYFPFTAGQAKSDGCAYYQIRQWTS